MRFKLLVAAGFLLALTACQGDESYRSTRQLAPIPSATLSLMAEKGVSASDPILMRSYKKESEIEVWKRKPDGRYALLKTYPMCRWSGQLGPKVKEGDRQAPEGFYDVTPAAMNPNSSLFLSFNLGYPNAYDRQHGRTGSHLMVHGSCSSQGCFAMTDEAISEVYAVAREAFAGGQRSFQFQSYPFRMTPENLAKHRYDSHIAFWRNLKDGSDQFEVAKQEPAWTVASGRYAFKSADPAIAAAVAVKQALDDRTVADLVTKGTPAIRLVYDDGGGHQSFREASMAAAGASAYAALDDRTRRSLGDVSRPDALARGPEEIAIPGNSSNNLKPTTTLRPLPVRPRGVVATKQPDPLSLKNSTAVVVASAAEKLPEPPRTKPSIYDRVVGTFLGR